MCFCMQIHSVCVREREKEKESASVSCLVEAGIWICQASSPLYLTNTPSEEHTNEGRAPNLVLSHPHEKDIKRRNDAFQIIVVNVEKPELAQH